MKNKFLGKLFVLIILSLVCVGVVKAKIGVGVNTGAIRVEEKLKAGMIHKLPPITVINTGDEPAEYVTTVAYHQDQPELRPDQSWFVFTPANFHLEPGGSQIVEIKINLPLKIKPGDYFAYLEGHPVVTVQKGTTTLGVAAAAKLYFTVTPANMFYGVYYRLSTFMEVYKPWPQRILTAVGILALIILFKKYFNLKIDLRKPEKISEKSKDE